MAVVVEQRDRRDTGIDLSVGYAKPDAADGVGDQNGGKRAD